MDIRQCKRCSKLFQYTGKALCPACTNEMDKKFIMVRDYIYDCPGASMEQICEATETEPGDIRRWLSEGRLIMSKGSMPLLKCEKCGTPIYTGRLCDQCIGVMRSDLKGAADSLRPAPPPISIKEDGKMHIKRKK